MPEWIIEEPQETGLGANLKRIGTGAGLSALKGLENIADLFGGTGFPNPSKQIEERFGLTPEYLQPRNLPEQFIQRFAQFAPTAGALGGLSGLATTALGSGVGSLAEYAGLPQPVSDIAQLGTELAAGRYTGKIPSIRQAQKIEDTLARAAVKPNTRANAQAIQDALKTVESSLGTEVSRNVSKEINHTIRKIGENITGKTINPTTAMDLRKKLYKQGSRLDPAVAATYIDPLTKGINDFFAIYSAENPTFYKHLNARDRLTELKNMNLYLSNIIKGMNLPKVPVIGNLAETIASTIVGEGERFARGLLKNDVAREHYFKAIKNTNSPQIVAKNLVALKSEMPEIFGEEQTSVPSGTPQWIIEE